MLHLHTLRQNMYKVLKFNLIYADSSLAFLKEKGIWTSLSLVSIEYKAGGSHVFFSEVEGSIQAEVAKNPQDHSST